MADGRDLCFHDRLNIRALDTSLRNFCPDLSTVLLRLKVEGTLDLLGRELFERRIRTGLGSAFRRLRLDLNDLHLKPSCEERNSIKDFQVPERSLIQKVFFGARGGGAAIEDLS